MQTIDYCPACGQDQRLQVQFDEATMTFELWCPRCVLLVERVTKETYDTFLELGWQLTYRSVGPAYA